MYNVYAWCLCLIYAVKSAPSVTSLVFMRRFGLFLGTVQRVNLSQLNSQCVQKVIKIFFSYWDDVPDLAEDDQVEDGQDAEGDQVDEEQVHPVDVNLT